MSQLNICMWNIQGIKNIEGPKLNDPRVAQILTRYDIIGLVETHAGQDCHFSLDGYEPYSVSRPRLTTAKRDYGGLAVFIKDSITKGTTVCESEHLPFELIWVRCAKSFFGWDSDLMLGILYLPPANSPYTRRALPDIFDRLEKEVLKASKLGSVMLMGDLNARTGTEPDCPEFLDDPTMCLSQDPTGALVDDVGTLHPIPVRRNQDLRINTYGKNLLELWTSYRQWKNPGRHDWKTDVPRNPRE